MRPKGHLLVRFRRKFPKKYFSWTLPKIWSSTKFGVPRIERPREESFAFRCPASGSTLNFQVPNLATPRPVGVIPANFKGKINLFFRPFFLFAKHLMTLGESLRSKERRNGVRPLGNIYSKNGFPCRPAPPLQESQPGLSTTRLMCLDKIDIQGIISRSIGQKDNSLSKSIAPTGHANALDAHKFNIGLSVSPELLFLKLVDTNRKKCHCHRSRCRDTSGSNKRPCLRYYGFDTRPAVLKFPAHKLFIAPRPAGLQEAWTDGLREA